jgi:hypothetical protein
MPNAGMFNLTMSMKKFKIISRIGIIAVGLCVAATVFAEKPASTRASPSPASKAKAAADSAQRTELS